MSNFYCDECGAIISEDRTGHYVTRCEHYPVEERTAKGVVDFLEYLRRESEEGE